MSKAYQKSIGRSTKHGNIDFWRTPPQATQALFDMETFYGKNTLEPGCGAGDMTKILQKNGLNVTTSDIYPWDMDYTDEICDFLHPNSYHTNQFDHVITNPPYHLAEEFIWKALKVSKGKVAMLLPLEFMQAQKRIKLFTEAPLHTIYVFSYRIPFWKKGYDKPLNNKRHAWYVWSSGNMGIPYIGWIEPPKEGVDKLWWK